jgi:hypothetical protein
MIASKFVLSHHRSPLVPPRYQIVSPSEPIRLEDNSSIYSHTYHSEYRFLGRLLKLARDDQLVQDLQKCEVKSVNVMKARMCMAGSQRRPSEN